MDKSKKFAIAQGYVMNGVFFPHAHLDIAREGRKAKRLTDAPPTFGAKRAQKGDLAPYHHGVALCDTPNTVGKLSEGRQVPTHPGMRSRVARGAEANGFDTLRKATDPQCHDNADDRCHALPSGMKR